MGKRSEITVDEREVRATIPESRGRKRVSENDGRIDLDEADLEMARKAAEAGLALARKTTERKVPTEAKSVRVDAVSNRWCDIADENWRSGPFLKLENWNMGFEKSDVEMNNLHLDEKPWRHQRRHCLVSPDCLP